MNNKDILKFSIIDALISRGVEGSSSYYYAIDPLTYLKLNIPVNPEDYTDYKYVGVSVNGFRRNRLSFDRRLINKAIDNGCIIIADNSYHRNRQYNIGERELYDYLVHELGCVYTEDSIRGYYTKIL